MNASFWQWFRLCGMALATYLIVVAVFAPPADPAQRAQCWGIGIAGVVVAGALYVMNRDGDDGDGDGGWL